MRPDKHREEIFKGILLGDGLILIERSYGGANVVDCELRIAGSADQEAYSGKHVHARGNVYLGLDGLMDSVVAHIRDDAHDLIG